MFTLRIIVGVIEDNGRFPASTKLAGGGGGDPGVELLRGVEKSSISLLRTIPVDVERILAPKYPFIVVVIDTAFLSLSTTER